MPTPTIARSPFARPRWSAADARQVLTALERSGKSVPQFAAEHGLDPQRVYLWRRRLGGRTERPKFTELMVAPSLVARGAAAESFEIVFGSGHTLRIPASFDPLALGRLLDVLARAGAC